MGRLLIHDLDLHTAGDAFGKVSDDVEIFSALPTAAHCIGCFNCWIGTPGLCVFDDKVRGVPAKLSKCSELILVSRLVYGGLSPDLKAVIDRIIPYLLPFFKIKDKKMRHTLRYSDHFFLSYYFYTDGNGGNIPEYNEMARSVARGLAYANKENFGVATVKVVFVENKANLAEVTF
jgi:multimeric flavodoxin WrbA